MSTYDTLNRAAEIMIERGHTKEVGEDAEGHVCVMGAVGLARTGDAFAYVDDFPSIEAAVDALRAVLGRSVALWNDRPETTEAMAVSVLHEAALYAKENGL